jgi:hypothetical protein
LQTRVRSLQGRGFARRGHHPFTWKHICFRSRD